MKSTFWSEASRGGAILGLVSAASSCLGMVLPQSVGFVITLANFVLTIYLLFYFTKRRAEQFPSEGYSYSQCLGFMAGMGIFAGIIAGAYQIVASNFFFAEKYEELYAATVALYSQMGAFNNEVMEQMTTLMRSYIFSPLPSLVSNIFSMVLTFCFYGLFIAVGTKREADIFDNTDEGVEE